MIDILTGTAFDATERMHHREDEVALEFPSSVNSRRRGLLALRAQNWRAAKAPLPYDHAVEYIYTDGSAQWIDTGYMPCEKTEVRASIYFRVGGRNIWGVYDNPRNLTAQSGGNWRFDGITVNISAYPSSRIDIVQNVSGVKYGSDTYKYGASSAFRATKSFTIGTQNGQGSAATYCPLTIYSFQILEGGALVRDFIPVRKDGVGYLYDRVSGELFGNQGTGAFGIGGDI